MTTVKQLPKDKQNKKTEKKEYDGGNRKYKNN